MGDRDVPALIPHSESECESDSESDHEEDLGFTMGAVDSPTTMLQLGLPPPPSPQLNRGSDSDVSTESGNLHHSAPPLQDAEPHSDEVDELHGNGSVMQEPHEDDDLPASITDDSSSCDGDSIHDEDSDSDEDFGCNNSNL